MTITIHGVLRSRASRNAWLLEEMGLPFRLVPVIQHGRAGGPAAADIALTTRSPEFLAVNPNGQIPVFEEDGLLLTESLAINLHIVRRHGGPLAGRDAAEEAKITQWTLWSATEVEPHSIQILYHRVMWPEERRNPARAQDAVEALRAPIGVLDAALAESGHPVGGRFTVADIAIAETLRYAMPAAELFEAAPRVKAWLAACHARPAFRRMWEAREKEVA
jgi:glutathione S-transferase